MKFMQYYLGKWIFNFVFLIGVAVLNLPNVLTISRIVVIPVIFLSIYIHSVLWSIVAGALFVTASITDYLDGYFARSRNQNSVLGRLLDPIADKLLVVSALVIVVANQLVTPLTYIPVIIIMCREVLVSGLREFLAEFHVGMLLWVAGILTFITGYQYFEKCLDYIYTVENNKKNPVKQVEQEVKKIAVKVKNSVEKAVVKKAAAKRGRKAKTADAETPAPKKTAAKAAVKNSRRRKKAAAKTGVKEIKPAATQTTAEASPAAAADRPAAPEKTEN